MVDTNAVISGVNQKLVGSLTTIKWANVFGWLVFIILIAGFGLWAYYWYSNSRLFNKKITAFDTVGEYWEPVLRDTAKSVKLGSGGFEIVYLKKLKTWKIAYGGRIGKNTYYFFILPDGYWYNGMLKAGINKILENKGLVPIVTTNPLMRGQYTALEKQIESLHGQKLSVWDKYGSWILGISFVVIAGVMLWLNYMQYVKATGNLSGVVEGFSQLVDKLNILTSNIQTKAVDSGLIKA